jgi:hypothetical protein
MSKPPQEKAGQESSPKKTQEELWQNATARFYAATNYFSQQPNKNPAENFLRDLLAQETTITEKENSEDEKSPTPSESPSPVPLSENKGPATFNHSQTSPFKPYRSK